MTTSRGWAIIAAVFVFALMAVLQWGPPGQPPQRPLEAAVTVEPGPPVALALPTSPGPYTATQGAVRVSLPPPTTAPDPLAGFEGRYACRFATAGRVTPCCPDATETLAVYWSGADLAVADYVVGRESGCRASIVNTAGCVGWFQLCGKTCDGPCTDGDANAARARDLWAEYGWCSTASWYLRGDPVTGGGRCG